MSDSSILVYSSICGNYDNGRSDIPVIGDSPVDKFKQGVMNAKIYKTIPHKFFSNPYSIWVDGNIFLRVIPQVLIDEFLKDADIAVFSHPYRSCIYEEHHAARSRLDPHMQIVLDEQIIHYRENGYPSKNGLAECGVIIRRNNNTVQEFNEKWWMEICRYSSRDQISFMYVWNKMKNKIKINLINGNVRNHPYFKFEGHK